MYYGPSVVTTPFVMCESVDAGQGVVALLSNDLLTRAIRLQLDQMLLAFKNQGHRRSNMTVPPAVAMLGKAKQHVQALARQIETKQAVFEFHTGPGRARIKHVPPFDTL